MGQGFRFELKDQGFGTELRVKGLLLSPSSGVPSWWGSSPGS